MRGENGKESLMVCFHPAVNCAHWVQGAPLISDTDKSKSKKVKMNYSSHGMYKGIYLVFSLFSLHSS